jgi:hypothetical protein
MTTGLEVKSAHRKCSVIMGQVSLENCGVETRRLVLVHTERTSKYTPIINMRLGVNYNDAGD